MSIRDTDLDFDKLPPKFKEAYVAIMEYTEALTALTLIDKDSQFQVEALFPILYTRSRIQTLFAEIGEVAENTGFDESITTAYIELRTRLSALDTLLDINSFKIPPKFMIAERQQQFSDLTKIPHGHWWWEIHLNAAEELKSLDVVVGKIALIVLAGNAALFASALDKLVSITESFWFFRPAPIFIPAAASSPAIASLFKQGKQVLNYFGRILEIPLRFRALFLLLSTVAWSAVLWSFLLFTPIPARFIFEEAYNNHTQGNFERATEQYEAAVNLNPDLSIAWLGSCLIKLEFNDLEGALSDCEIARRKGSLSAYHVSSWIYLSEQKYVDAARIARTGLRITGVDSSSVASRIDLVFLYKNLAIAEFHLEQVSLAYQSINQAILLGGGDSIQSSPPSLQRIRWLLLSWKAIICEEVCSDYDFIECSTCQFVWEEACFALHEDDDPQGRSMVVPRERVLLKLFESDCSLAN